jgi:hypothetical protein
LVVLDDGLEAGGVEEQGGAGFWIFGF